MVALAELGREKALAIYKTMIRIALCDQRMLISAES